MKILWWILIAIINIIYCTIIMNSNYIYEAKINELVEYKEQLEKENERLNSLGLVKLEPDIDDSIRLMFISIQARDADISELQRQLRLKDELLRKYLNEQRTNTKMD